RARYQRSEDVSACRCHQWLLSPAATSTPAHIGFWNLRRCDRALRLSLRSPVAGFVPQLPPSKIAATIILSSGCVAIDCDYRSQDATDLSLCPAWHHKLDRANQLLSYVRKY